MELWLLGFGWRECDPGYHQVCVDVVDIAVAASITLPEHSHAAHAGLRREYHRGNLNVFTSPGCGQPFDWTLFRRRGGRVVFQRLRAPRPAAGTIHDSN